MIVKKTATGWMITTTGYSDYYNAYIIGCSSGRKILYSKNLIESEGFRYDNNPQDSAGCQCPDITIMQYLEHRYPNGSKIIRKGDIIR